MEGCRAAIPQVRGNPVSMAAERGLFSSFLGRGWHMARVGKKRAGHLLDGREWREFPV